jgi:hypothetical protein
MLTVAMRTPVLKRFEAIPMARRAARMATLAVLAACGETAGPDPVDSVAVTPPALSLQLGTQPTGQLTAVPRSASGEALTGRAVTWLSLQNTVATVSQSGLVTAIAPGSATIHATVEGVAGVATVAVTVAPVASVSVSLGWAMLELAETTAASAVLRDAVGNPLSGRVIEWSSQDTTIATVSPAGVVTAVAAGTTRIAALSEGVSGSTQVAVFDHPPNLTLDGLYLTQAVQRWEGGVPLVAGGHPVLVNVFGTLDRPFRPGRPPPQLRLTAYHGAVEILADQRPITGSAGPAVNQLVPLHQVVLPAGVAATGLRVVATVNPGGVVPEATLADNSWSRSGEPVDVAVIAMPTLQLHFVPIHLSTGGSVGNVAPETMPEYRYATQQMHPVAGIDVTIGGTLTSGVAFGDGQAAAWLAILQALDLVRVSEGSTRYYVGALRPPPGVTFVQYGGYAYIPSDPASIGPGTRTAVVVGVGWFNRQRQTTELVAHELGHTMGRSHAPCGSVAGPDPGYPYPSGMIGAHGHDLYTYSLAPTGLPAAYAPNGASDVMSYCLPAWISDYNYEALMAARLAGGPPLTAAAPPRADRCECLVVWGAVEDGRVTLRPAFTVSTVPAPPEREGPYRLEGLRRDGSLVFSYAFDPSVIDHAPSVRHFTFAIPVTPAERESITRIRVTGGERTVELAARGPDQGATAPVTARRAGSGVEVRWDASAYPGVVVRDPVTRAIVGIGGTGSLTLPAAATELEVLASDGVRTQVTRVRVSPQ